MYTGKKTGDVFGLNTTVNDYSYVDRGAIDKKLQELLARDNHVAIRGDSKTGKSWLRQRVLKDPIVIQCRLGKTVVDIYKEALATLDVKLTVSESTEILHRGSLSANSTFGFNLITNAQAKLGINAGVERRKGKEVKDFKQDIHNLETICEIIKASGRRLVIEDFHYLSESQRKSFSFDLKTMWDYSCFIMVIGVWAEDNLLFKLNPDLTGRVREISIRWDDFDLIKILDQGSGALNLQFSQEVRDYLVSISYGNAGILQRLAIDTLDQASIFEQSVEPQLVNSIDHVDAAALYYAEELTSVYRSFANNVSSGIRSRKNSTGIYAHALAVVLDSSDEDIQFGVPTKTIFEIANKREPRIQLGNLKTILQNIEKLQVDSEGRGLVLAYAGEKVRVVDYQLLLYRRFSTVTWPWEELIRQAESDGENYLQTETVIDQ